MDPNPQKEQDQCKNMVFGLKTDFIIKYYTVKKGKKRNVELTEKFKATSFSIFLSFLNLFVRKFLNFLLYKLKTRRKLKDLLKLVKKNKTFKLAQLFFFYSVQHCFPSTHSIQKSSMSACLNSQYSLYTMRTIPI